jgi:hypothetical protein
MTAVIDKVDLFSSLKPSSICFFSWLSLYMSG